MKRFNGMIAVVLLLLLVLTGCNSGVTEQEAVEEKPESNAESQTEPGSTYSGEDVFVTIATGGSSGAYFALGGTVSNLLNVNIPGVNASVQSTGASAVNSTLIGNKKAELAFAMNDVVNYAFTGTEAFAEKGSFENLRGVASLYPNFVQAITIENKGIESIEGLKGKKVGVGAPGSGTEVNARQILMAHGLTYDDIEEDFLSYAEAVEQLKNGAIDAAFLTSGIPNAAIMDLATTKDVKIIPIKKDVVEKLFETFPFYSSEVIPAGTYDNEVDVETAAVTTILITHKDLDENLVYEMTKTIFENLDALGDTHASGKKISIEKSKIGMPIPLHSGALKYFSENQ